MRRDPPSRTSLLVRNIPRTITGEDLRYHAEKYGPVRDVYLPKDYYTGEPRGIGFVEFTNGRDAEDAKYAMDGMSFNGRQISVVFALQGRKRPDDYRRGQRAPERSNYRGYGGRRRSYSRSPRRSASRSPRRRSASRSPRRSLSRSRSPAKRQYRRSVSRSPDRERDEYRRGPGKSPPPRDSRSPPRSRGRSDEEDDYEKRD